MFLVFTITFNCHILFKYLIARLFATCDKFNYLCLKKKKKRKENKVNSSFGDFMKTDVLRISLVFKGEHGNEWLKVPRNRTRGSQELLKDLRRQGIQFSARSGIEDECNYIDFYPVSLFASVASLVIELDRLYRATRTLFLPVFCPLFCFFFHPYYYTEDSLVKQLFRTGT